MFRISFSSQCVSGVVLSLFLAVSAIAAENPFHGLRVEPPKKISKHMLVDQDGKPAVFPADRWQLVFFGFTSCPDVCPVTLRKALQALQSLGSESNKPGITFISIDADHDKPAVVKEFLSKHDSKVQGLTGQPGATQAVGNEFEVVVRRYQDPSGLSYRVEHSAFIYLLDPQGRLVMFYPATAEGRAMADDIRRLIAPVK